jgi:hypothetical protein
MHQTEEPFVVLADHILGLRGLALIFYGALPANLAVIGALKLEPKDTAPSWPILGLLVLPVVITSLLIRNRQKEWYVSAAFLNVRCVLTTLLILVCSIAIYDAAQMARGSFTWSALWPLWTVQSSIALRESILFGVLSLMVSSTLFMTLLTKGGELPGLPSSQALTALAAIRQGLRTVQKDPIWRECPAGEMSDIAKTVESLVKELDGRGTLGLASFARDSLEPLAAAVKDLEKVVEELGDLPDVLRLPSWKVYFAPKEELTKPEKDERQAAARRFNSLQCLFWTRWGS